MTNRRLDIADERIINSYINEKRNRLNELYKSIHDHKLRLKTNIINNRNETREDPIEYKKTDKALE